MNSIRLKGRHLVHSQTTRKVRILVCRKIASWTESISGGKNSVTVLSYNPKDTCSNIIHSIWPKAGAYFRGRSCARFDSSYAVKRCLKNENILPSLRAIGARKISGKCFIKTLTAKVQRICFNGRQSVHSRTVCGVRIPVCSITASCKEDNHNENLPKLVA